MVQTTQTFMHYPASPNNKWHCKRTCVLRDAMFLQRNYVVVFLHIDAFYTTDFSMTQPTHPHHMKPISLQQSLHSEHKQQQGGSDHQFAKIIVFLMEMIWAFTNGMPKSCHTMEQYDYFKAILVVQLITSNPDWSNIVYNSSIIIVLFMVCFNNLNPQIS